MNANNSEVCPVSEMLSMLRTFLIQLEDQTVNQPTVGEAGQLSILIESNGPVMLPRLSLLFMRDMVL